MQRGFSTLEIILVIAILALLSSGLVGVYVGLRNSVSVESAADTFRTALVQQRTRAQGGEDRKDFGVRAVSHSDQPYYELYSYSDITGTTTGERVNLPETISFTDPAVGNERSIQFESITGRAAPESFTLSSPSGSVTVSVSASGLVQ